MMVIQVGESGNVTVSKLSEQGIKNMDDPAEHASDGHWNPWSKWMSADEALKQIEGFVNEE
jgi:hypothetical protein